MRWRKETGELKKTNINYKFSEEEYKTWRDEILARSAAINNQSQTAIVTIISTWVIGITLLILTSENQKIEAATFLAVSYIECLVFIIPIFYFIPLAIKSGENLQQIASISAYIRVFHEYLSMGQKNKIKNWEITNSMTSVSFVDRGKNSRVMYIYNEEYTILSFLSFVLYAITAWVACHNIYSLNDSIIFCVINTVIFIVLGVVCLFSVIFIHRVSCVKYWSMGKIDWYIKAYIARAVELGLIDSDDDRVYEILKTKKSLSEFI